MNVKERIDFLRKEISGHNHSYYVLDTPAISDFEFDSLLKELQNLENLHPEYFDRNSPTCLLYTSPSPRDRTRSRMPSSA